MCSVESWLSTTIGVEDAMGLTGEKIDFNFETMKMLHVLDSKTFPKLTDLPVIRCISKALITFTMVSKFYFMKKNVAN